MKSNVFALALLIAGACAPYKPMVTAFNGDSVTIQPGGLAVSAEEEERENMKEASRLCASKGKNAQYASTKVLPGYVVETLYLCL